MTTDVAAGKRSLAVHALWAGVAGVALICGTAVTITLLTRQPGAAPAAYLPSPQPAPQAQAPVPTYPAPVTVPAAQPSPTQTVEPTVMPQWMAAYSVDDGFEMSQQATEGFNSTIRRELASVDDVPASASAQTPPAIDPNKVILAFVDPTCPYCKQAHEALASKFPVQYVPVNVLGANPQDGEGNILGILRLPKDQRAGALSRVMAGDNSGLDLSPDPILQSQLSGNRKVLNLTSANMPGQRLAVPTFMIPLKDGRTAVVQGWSDNTARMIEDHAYRGG